MKKIGILLDHRTWKGIPSRRTGHEKIQFYNKAAQKHRLTPFYFSLQQLFPAKRKIKGYLYRNGSYRLVTRSIPPVIHNRSMPFTRGLRNKLGQLSKQSIVYNAHTRYTKLKIHKLLSKKGNLEPHLPKTKRFAKDSLRRMMEQFKELYVKPSSGSIGKGIFKLEQVGKGEWKIQTSGKTRFKPSNKVYRYLRGKVGQRSFLVQEAIPLAKYKGRPYDIRVSVQKSSNGKWQVTGMVGKVAGKGKHVTNVARGGKVKTCDVLFAHCGWDVKKTTEIIEDFSLRVAKHLGKKLNRLADVGFDIGLDQGGKPYFIEMNGRDLRYSFRDGGLPKRWFKTYENPIKYGKYLLKKGR
ncbi:YheC/YheD family protein [Ammoniphilus resinae]|uniref:YheC/YheD family protein n=1 Tax=Ammoniphilus resinae TaxID=861532 RepID=A0ABS4GRS4_9BACL|nr:YheC/YheD family protein [Ammoniphilus resinae]MBP1932973.1 hypothetical protein [Ammoniphilus resinae]